LRSDGSGGVRSPWRERRARAAQLLGKVEHAEELLTFYVALVEIQEAVAGRAPIDRWRALVEGDEEGDLPRLRIERLPIDELVAPFDDFLGRMVDVGTDVIAGSARALLETGSAVRPRTLRTAVEHGEGEDRQADFLARAFLEPVVTSLALGQTGAMARCHERRCCLCGAPPVVAVLRDDSEALGTRTLVCSMCGTEWRYERLTCPNCGETDTQRLRVHTAESIAHVRVDECTTCDRYLKTIDLRRQGGAVPVVDELATVELDLWARQRGLVKLQHNVLGL
jgi:FdhE protein